MEVMGFELNIAVREVTLPSTISGLFGRRRARFGQIVESFSRLASYEPIGESSGDEFARQSMSRSHVDSLTASGRHRPLIVGGVQTRLSSFTEWESVMEKLIHAAMVRTPWNKGKLVGQSPSWIRRSVAVGVSSNIGDHIDVRVCTAVLRLGCANFQYLCWPTRFVHQVMAIGITTPKRRAVPSSQYFLAGVSDQRQLAVDHPDELVLMAVPVPLTGPSARLDDRQIDAELCQPRKSSQPLAVLGSAGLVEGARIGAGRLRGHNG
jgi:hypothetical protein